jgi:hypothetical protein
MELIKESKYKMGWRSELTKNKIMSLKVIVNFGTDAKIRPGLKTELK